MLLSQGSYFLFLIFSKLRISWLFQARGIGIFLLVFGPALLPFYPKWHAQEPEEDKNTMQEEESFLVQESLRPSRGQVLDVFEYTIEWEGSLEMVLPEEGDLQPEGMDLPYAEILSIETEKDKSAPDRNQTRIRIRFFMEGEFLPPVKWKKPDEEEYSESQKSFQVTSRLTPESVEEADAFPPWVFGEFLWHRLVLLLLGIGILGLGGFYLWKWYKTRAMDAILETPFVPPVEEWVDKKFRDLFEKEKVDRKEFAYLLTEYIKLRCSDKFGSNYSSFTDSELLDKIYKSSAITQDAVQSAKFFFLYSKYSPGKGSLERKEAEDILEEWKKRLG